MGLMPGEAGRPLAMRSADDRGPAYTAAVERSEAAFTHVFEVLGVPGRMVNTAGELAAVAAALPAETSVLLDGVMRVPAGAHPGEDWTPAVVASVVMLAECPAVPVRDLAGLEHDVPVPGVEIRSWLLPPGTDVPLHREGRPAGLYDRMTEALRNDGPGDSLPAVAAVLEHIAELLRGDDSPAEYLATGGAAAAGITGQADRLRDAAAGLRSLAVLAAAESQAGSDS